MDIASEMRGRMWTGGGPLAVLPTPELNLAVPHLGHNVGFLFDSDAHSAGPCQGNLKIKSVQDIILHQMFSLVIFWLNSIHGYHSARLGLDTAITGTFYSSTYAHPCAKLDPRYLIFMKQI